MTQSDTTTSMTHEGAPGLWRLGPACAAETALAAWLQSLPYEHAAQPSVLTAWGSGMERGFPRGVLLRWPANHPWIAIPNPWRDPGMGHVVIELVGDHEELEAQRVAVTHALYRDLVLEPPGPSGLLLEAGESLGEETGWNSAKVQALLADSCPLQRDADWLALGLQREPSEARPEEDAGEFADRPRMFLALHAGSGPLWNLLLPRIDERWADAVLLPRDGVPERIAALPRTGLAESWLPALRWAARWGALRRGALIERIAEVLHLETWDVQLTAVPLLDQAEWGMHAATGGALCREAWQLAQAEADGWCFGGFGSGEIRWRWSALPRSLPAATGLGCPFEPPRVMEPREALRTLEDWTLVESLRNQQIPLRAGSKTLLRTMQPAAFGERGPWLEWAQGVGLIEDVRRVAPLGYVVG